MEGGAVQSHELRYLLNIFHRETTSFMHGKDRKHRIAIARSISVSLSVSENVHNDAQRHFAYELQGIPDSIMA